MSRKKMKRRMILRSMRKEADGEVERKSKKINSDQLNY
jgi:phosphopantetheine adenylyltransferase